MSSAAAGSVAPYPVAASDQAEADRSNGSSRSRAMRERMTCTHAAKKPSCRRPMDAIDHSTLHICCALM